MNRIAVEDIPFASLKIMSHQGSKSIIYEDDEICYKILDGLLPFELGILDKKLMKMNGIRITDGYLPFELDILEKKLMNMDGIRINDADLPIDLIVNGEKLVGFTTKKFNKSITIYDKFSGQFVDFKELFGYITKACKVLREIHKHQIICQDLSFDNILVDNNGNVAFCDLDGCSYNGYESPFIAMPMKKLIYEYRKEEFVICENFDRISMLVSLYYLLYNKYLYKISRREFEFLSSEVETMKNTMIYVKALLDKSRKIPEVPYLDELIVTKDDYVMDREKQFNLLRRILKK